VLAATTLVKVHNLAGKNAMILGNTVEPLNKGHFGSRAFVLFWEVVLVWEVLKT